MDFSPEPSPASITTGRKVMKSALAVAALSATFVTAALAQATDPNPALNHPDKVSWELFTGVTRAVGNNVVFETWASNEDTFQANPKFPGTSGPPSCQPVVAAGPAQPALAAAQAVTPTASPKILNVPALLALAPRDPNIAAPAVAPAAPGDQESEETRRNKATFDFIFCNKLHTRAGLRAAFAAGTPISFPTDSIEVKANWVLLGTRNPADYYVNTASDGKRYALIALHIISKMVPNWTWATFEHKDNLGRCDFIGCHDKFGAVVQDVPAHPLTSPHGRYDPCVKTPAVKKLFSDAGLPPLWENYCLKGSQVDYVSATGVPTLLGNSVTENRFDNTSSCISCHARAAVDAQGQKTTGAGFLSPAVPALCPTGNPCSPNGAPNPAWFWNNPGQATQSMLALQTDFIWSIARHAVGP
jgi:hypothetical protein